MRRKSKILLLLLAVIMTGLAYYEIVYPAQIAKAYQLNLNNHTNNLHGTLNQVAESTEKGVLTDEDLSFESTENDIKSIRGTIERANQDLDDYLVQANNLRALGTTGYIGTYKKAKIQRKQAENIVQQSKEVLRDYENLVEYIHILNEVEQVYELKTTSINAVSDLTFLSAKKVYADQQELSASAGKLKNTKPPESLIQSQVALVETIKNTANGFGIVAAGLNVGSQFELDRGIGIVEKQTANYDSSVKTQSLSAMSGSSVIKKVVELPSKTNFLTSR